MPSRERFDRRQVSLPITTTSTASWPTWYQAAWLTVPEACTGELQILVHGAGGDHRYWDWPREPATYSYVEWCAQRGVATLNVDRIGCGSSVRPPASEVTVDAQAHALVQVAEAVRAGLPGCDPFDQVVLVGHSMGSVVAGAAACLAPPVDAVVLTGYLPVDGGVELGDELFDFAFEPASGGLPGLLGLVGDGYLVAKDLGTDDLLHWAPTADPDNVEAEKLMKGPATRAELRDAAVVGAALRESTIDTLVVVGQHDALLIDGTLGEPDVFATVEHVRAKCGANFEFVVIPDAGHVLNLHRNAHTSFTPIRDWLDGRSV
jgi:pimeloyl-ACP methyl ester carboxylesterase